MEPAWVIAAKAVMKARGQEPPPIPPPVYGMPAEDAKVITEAIQGVPGPRKGGVLGETAWLLGFLAAQQAGPADVEQTR
jgi:hypothetical protein